MTAVKGEIRVLGIDDGFFPRKARGEPVLLVGAVMRGNSYLDGVVSTAVTLDGTDATERIISLVHGTRHRGQLRAIMINGLTLAGFNVVDIRRVSEETGLPVITLVRKQPDLEAIKKALSHFDDGAERLKIIGRAGKIFHYKKILFQAAGVAQDRAQDMIDVCLMRSLIPEPVRVAHLIASGVTKGESGGRV